jgi:hypothetical protein
MHTVPCYKKKVLTMVGQQIERSLYKKKGADGWPADRT